MHGPNDAGDTDTDAPRGSAPPLLAAVPRQRTGAASPLASTPARPRTRAWTRLRGARRALPTPTGTPFTFTYLLVLIATSLFTEYGDPDTVSALLRASSTDAAHLAETPSLVLLASALWVAGGLASAYGLAFVFVLTALERRIGGLRTAGVFLLGHVAATLATEVPVGISVLTGHLPASSLHRLDYGISFGLLASLGALTGLLGRRPRTAVLAVVALVLGQDLVALVDPLASWGHPMALLSGIACWPLVRRWSRARTDRDAATGAAPVRQCAHVPARAHASARAHVPVRGSAPITARSAAESTSS
ncbi:rhomboid-like protein [Streptomyces sp. NPDC050504]|uniref:rhomboid-like protein n=1 Tax=Streptomyces sp. NPDC050504 TaxID=3365618 RepID=UPI0037AB7603